MPGAYLHYVLRYPLVLLYACAMVHLLLLAIRSFRKRIKGQQTPAHGYFLMSQTADALHVHSFALYSLTQIGRAASNDICIRNAKLLRHHAQIYLYNGEWYIKAASERARVTVNHMLLQGPRKLYSKDLIGLGDNYEMAFVDERHAAAEAGLVYDPSPIQPDRQLSSLPAQIALIAYYFYAAVALISYSDPRLAFLSNELTLSLALFIFVQSLYAIVLPHYFRQFDSILYTAFCTLFSTGWLFQLRYLFLNRPWDAIIELYPDTWQQDLWREFIKLNIYYFEALLCIPAILLFVSRTRLLERIAKICFFLTPALYVLTMVLGRDVANTGARLWLPLPGGFQIQVTEFAKITYLIALAYFFMNRPDFKRQVIFALWAVGNYVLILLLPDLGSMMILLPLTLIVYVVMTSAYWMTGFIMVCGAGISYYAFHHLAYVQRRIHGWLTLWDEVNPQNSQIIYGLQAISRGQLFGVGFGNSDPRAIPLAKSDMVFTSYCEEMGLIMGLMLIIAFIIIWLRSAQAFARVRDGYTAAVILGAATLLFVQMTVVVGGSTGLIPLTGATLPFVAQGGSSLLASAILIALLLGAIDRSEVGAYKR